MLQVYPCKKFILNQLKRSLAANHQKRNLATDTKKSNAFSIFIFDIGVSVFAKAPTSSSKDFIKTDYLITNQLLIISDGDQNGRHFLITPPLWHK